MRTKATPCVRRVVSVSRRSFQTSRSRSRGNVGRSRSRLGLKIKCLGLVSVSYHRVSFTSQYAQLCASLPNCTYIILNARRLYCLLIHKFSICYRLSVCCLSVCHLSSEMLVHPTKAVAVFGNVFTAFGTMAIR